MLLDILFVFCKLNPDVGYRQGMHELLAPILWVVERDAIDLGPTSRALGEEAVVRAVYDAEHIEHDSFALFSQVMHNAKNFYEQTTHSGQENPMVIRSKRIFGDMLPLVDPELAQHLEHIDVVPQTFLMRWIRLLFGREFGFDDMLLLWDVIFAEDPTLEIVDYVCLAMLLRIRWDLIDADYNSALTLLLRYPEPDKDNPAQTFALDALYLRDHLNTDGSGYLILKYTGQPLLPRDRPATPPALQRNITAFSGFPTVLSSPSGFPSSSGKARRGRDIEALFQSTAKNIYARGRSALDEVHKRAQEIRETQTPSLPPRPKAVQTGPAALYARVKALEERNKQLADLLEGAVGSLWEYQRVITEQSGNGDDGEPGERVEQLSMAIAKVQFVQVYLADTSLPMPESEPDTQSGGRSGSDGRDNEKAEMEEIAIRAPDAAQSPLPRRASEQPAANQLPVAATTATPSKRTSDAAEQLADPSTFDDEETQTPPASEQQVPAISIQKAAHVPDTPPSITDTMPAGPMKSPNASASPPGPRPPLAQSAYSWMLGQESGAAAKQPFARATSILPEIGRSRGFLFGGGGEDDGHSVPPERPDKSMASGRRSLRQGKQRQKATDAEVVDDGNIDLDTLSGKETDK